MPPSSLLTTSKQPCPMLKLGGPRRMVSSSDDHMLAPSLAVLHAVSGLEAHQPC